MIDFNYLGSATSQQKEEAKESFLAGFKEFRKEFEEKATSVTIDFNEPIDSYKFAIFEFKLITEKADFINRFQAVYPTKDIT